ncbi:hypothetical protein [Massilia sp. PWRC2]|uniref:hypothetical protein n=1 Tax=Massilia sp. PWRC2 TaxID=2804626 RepID=UPI003CF4EE95
MESQIIEVSGKGSAAADSLSVAERKALLVQRGEIYRIGLVRAKAQVLYETQPQALLHTAVDHAAFAIRSRIDSLLTPTGLSIGAVLPYALPLLRLLRKHQFGTKSKIALGAVAVLAGVGVYFQRKHRRDGAY